MYALIQGIIQGLTEFLPISSSGHVVLFGEIFGLRDDLPFTAFLHLGTFLAVLVFAFRKLVWVLRRPKLVGMIIVSTIPAGVVGLLFKDVVENNFNATVLPITFSLTAVFLALSKGRYGSKRLEDMTLSDAILIGLAQTLALFPGLSRSGLTISTAMLLGYEWSDAMYYSFILSLPVTLGAGLIDIGSVDPSSIAGLLSAMVAGLLGLWIVKLLINRGTFYAMGYYTLAVAVIAYFITGGSG